MMAYLASLTTARLSWRGVAPKVMAACRITGSTLAMAAWDREATMGKARRHWAMIMAVGV